MDQRLYHIRKLSYTFKNIQSDEKSSSLNSLLRRWMIWLRDRFFPSDQEEEKEKQEDFVLGPITMDISRNKLTAILGKSGSGKSTLLSILGLLRKADEGNVSVFLNEDIPVPVESLWGKRNEVDNFRAQHLGFALQRGELIPYLNMVQNAKLVSEYIHTDKNILDDRINDVFDQLYEGESVKWKNRLKRSLPQQVSQGQYQRGAILRALGNDPSIILADEPTGNLDQGIGKKVMQTFRDIVKKNGKSVLVITHDLHLAATYADEIFVLEHGKIKVQYLIEDDSSGKNQSPLPNISYPKATFPNTQEVENS